MLGCLAFLVSIVVSIYLCRILLDVRNNIRNLNNRVETLSNKVEGVVESVQSITTEVGTRTKGIVRVVDEHAGTAFTLIERFAPIMLGIGVIARIVSLAKRGK